MAAHDEHDFAQTAVVVEDVELVFEGASVDDFQGAVDGLGGAGSDGEERLALRTEAAVPSSAIRQAADADGMARGIVEQKGNSCGLSRREAGESALGLIDDRTRPVRLGEVAVDPNHEEDQTDGVARLG
jgi:hypothetical protein